MTLVAVQFLTKYKASLGSHAKMNASRCILSLFTALYGGCFAVGLLAVVPWHPFLVRDPSVAIPLCIAGTIGWMMVGVVWTQDLATMSTAELFHYFADQDEEADKATEMQHV
jgi:hypothetical protein